MWIITRGLFLTEQKVETRKGLVHLSFTSVCPGESIYYTVSKKFGAAVVKAFQLRVKFMLSGERSDLSTFSITHEQWMCCMNLIKTLPPPYRTPATKQSTILPKSNLGNTWVYWIYTEYGVRDFLEEILQSVEWLLVWTRGPKFHPQNLYEKVISNQPHPSTDGDFPIAIQSVYNTSVNPLWFIYASVSQDHRTLCNWGRLQVF